MKTQKEKGEAFCQLHARENAFIIPNPWDLGTALLLERLGFESLATTSAGYAFSVGQQDNTVDGVCMLGTCCRDCRSVGCTGQRGPGQRIGRRAGSGGGDDPPGSGARE